MDKIELVGLVNFIVWFARQAYVLAFRERVQSQRNGRKHLEMIFLPKPRLGPGFLIDMAEQRVRVSVGGNNPRDFHLRGPRALA